jgi:hypothetical protein
MSTEATPPAAPEKDKSAERIVSDAIDRHLADLAFKIGGDPLPLLEELERMRALSRLRESLTPTAEGQTSPGRRHLFGIAFVSAVAAILLCLAFLRVSSTAADFNVEASNVEIDFAGGGDSILIPGELEELIPLSHAEISGIENSDLPANAPTGDSLELPLQPQASGGTNPTPSVQLQQLSPPKSGPFTLNLDTAYETGGRGIVLSTDANQTSTAQFNAPVPLKAGPTAGPVSSQTSSPGHKSPNAPTVGYIVTGRKLRLELYPPKTQASVTILRNANVKAIRFQTAEPDHGTAVLGGSVFVRDLGDHPLPIQPGDELWFAGAPIRVRQLIFKNGQFQLSVSVPKASEIQLGVEPPRNLMPTIFERLSARWPTQLYTTLSAIVLLWLALEKWWKGQE